LAVRDPSRWKATRQRPAEPHEYFRIVFGPVADWERT
jgi:hypothetical protein